MDQKNGDQNGGTNHRGMERCFLGVVARCFWYHAISSRTCLFWDDEEFGEHENKKTCMVVVVFVSRFFLCVCVLFFLEGEGVFVCCFEKMECLSLFLFNELFCFLVRDKNTWYDEMCLF